MADRMLRLGVLISGSGTNMQAIVDATEDGRLDAEVCVVISNHEEAFGLERARRAGISAVWIDRTRYLKFADYNSAIRDVLKERGIDIVVMAGYMRLLGAEVLDAFPNRVLNIHPALLPSFPGASGIRDSFDYGVKVAGVTVHFANEKFDKGPIIMQEAFEIAEDDTVGAVEEKIHAIEHRIYPAALQLMAEDRVVIEGHRTRILPAR